jgi:diguanylate cyclase (GGDEF)-like protein/PAS domain S-box-containing protein
MLKQEEYGPADRAALIALGGIAACAATWTLYALVDNVLLGGQSLSVAFFAPELNAELARLITIVGVLTATVLIQVVYAKRMDAEQALGLERQRVREMYENSPDRIACLGEDSSVLYSNMHRATDDQVSSASDSHCYELLYSRTEACADCVLDGAQSGTAAAHTQVETADDGTERWFNKVLYPIIRDDGTTDSVVEIARDVTELHEMQNALERSHQQLETRIAQRTAELTKSNVLLGEEIAARERMSVALRESEARFRRLIDGSPDMIILHSEGLIDLVNPAGLRMLGATRPVEVVGRTFPSLWAELPSHRPPSVSHASTAGPAASPVIGQRLLRLDGSHLEVEMSETLVLLEGRIHVQCVIRDLTEAIRAREIINQMSYFDALTGLPNRELFTDRLQTALAGVRRNDMLLAVAFVDIDEFRKVNEAWGHDVGDALLTQFAERLQSLFRENDTVARRGSDEFAVVAQLRSPEEAALFAERIRDGLKPPFRVAGRKLAVSVSLGVALTAGHGVRPEAVVQRADEATRRARHSGPGDYCISSLDSEDSALPAPG